MSVGSKLKAGLANVYTFILTEKFLMIFLLLIVNNVYALVNWSLTNYYVPALYGALSGKYYLFILFLTILMSVYTTIHNFDSNYAILIRCGNKKKYYRLLLLRVVGNACLIFFVNLIMLLTVLNFSWKDGLGIALFGDYQVTNLSYMIFYVGRLFVIVLCLAMLFLYIIKLSSSMISYLINCFILLLSVVGNGFLKFIDKLSPVPLMYYKYLGADEFSSFQNEVLCSIIYVVGFVVFLMILEYVTWKYAKSE